jgi:hypothetical protein
VIFAYGGGGYGTLQEYMILDRYVDKINPDMVLWQFCANDLIINSHELESASFSNNNQMKRPYYENDQIKWLFPRQYRGWMDKAIHIQFQKGENMLKFTSSFFSCPDKECKRKLYVLFDTLVFHKGT